MEDYEKQLAELDRKREEILKKKEESMKTDVTRKDLEDLRKEFLDALAKVSQPRSVYSGGLVLTDISVFGSGPWKEGRILGPETKPSRPEKVSLPAWAELPK